jgi:hypothetical protein
MAKYKVGDVTYQFPDSYSPERVAQILKDQGIIGPPPPALPLPVAREPSVEFKPPASESAARTAEAQAAFESTKDLLEPEGSEGQAMRAERERLEARRKAAVTSLRAGTDKAVAEDTRFIVPSFRPTRIRELEPAAPTSAAPGTPQAMTDRQLDLAILSTGDKDRLGELRTEAKQREAKRKAEVQGMTAAELEELGAPRGPRPEGQRVYVDPTTGQTREPTALEELIESFGRQQVMSESDARGAAKRVAEQQAEIDRRISKGEDVGFFEFAGPVFSGILSRQDDVGAGTVETELGATMRSALGTLSALAAEGYFRALGYEVDQNGIPKDPDDFGYAVAELRRAAGIPEVIEPMRLLPIGMVATATQNIAERFSPELAASIGNAVSAIPQLAYPAPGVATQGTERVATSKDPEGRKRVSGIEVPDLLEDPKGFAEAEIRRVARSIASGRTMADEFFDSPETRRYYERVWGDEDAAYWGGAVGELLIPAGPGTAVRAGAGVTKALAGSKLGVAAARGVIKSAEALRGATGTSAAAARLLLDPAANLAAAASKGAVADGRLARRLAGKVLDDMNITPAQRNAAKAAMKPSSNTLEAITDDVGAVLDPKYKPVWATKQAAREASGGAARAMAPDVGYFYSTLRRNTPGDMVLITGNVAVPKAVAPEWIARSKKIRQGSFQRNRQEIIDQLLDRASRSRVRQTKARLAKLVEEVQKGAAPRLTPSEARKVDNAWRAITGEPVKATVVMRDSDELVRILGNKGLGASLAKEIKGRDLADFRGSATLAQIEDYLVNREIFKALPREARLTRDLTAAQVAMRDLDYGILDSVGARRLRAAIGGLARENIASARISRELTAAGQTTIREVGSELARNAERYGSLDEALDDMVIRRLAKVPVQEQWNKVLEAFYGNPESAKAALANAGASGLSPRLAVAPTVDAAKAVDRLFAQSGKAGLEQQSTLAVFSPDYHKAFIKVIIEEGRKKRLMEVFKLKSDFDAGIDVAAGQKARVAAELQAATRDPVLGKVAEVDLPTGPMVRLRVYDPAAYNTERLLAEGGSELVTLAESISPRIRGPLLQMATDAINWGIRGVGRNAATTAKYGRVVPNLPYIAAEAATPWLISLATQGVNRTGDAAFRAVARRFSTGGGFYTKAGTYYSPADLNYLARQNGLGLSAVESSRVGSLTNDILRSARDAARLKAAKSPVATKAALMALDELNPIAKSLGQRMAEAADTMFRRATFEARLIEGDSVADAADAARKSGLDFGAAPRFVQDKIGLFVASAAADYQFAKELILLSRKSPEAARVFYKSVLLKAREDDPYGVYGDKALKSLGLVNIDNKDYYVPGLSRPFGPIDGALTLARNVNQVLAALATAVSDQAAKGEFNAAPVAVEVLDGGARIIRSGIDVALPMFAAMLGAYDERSKGKPESAKVPTARAFDEDTLFWSAAVVAHHMDPDRTQGWWNTFLAVFQPKFVAPPPAYAAYPSAKKDDERRNYWSRQPPEGIPYLVWGKDPETNETIYKVFQPSDAGKFNLELLRKLPAEQLAEKAPWLYAMYLQSSGLYEPAEDGKPTEVRPGAAVPRLSAQEPLESAGRLFLAPAAPPATERQRQAAALSEAAAAAEKP